MTIKFTGLDPINAASVADTDLFILTDSSEVASKSIRFDELKTAVLPASTFSSSGSNIPLIIAGINAYNGALTNGLQAGKLFYDGSYREPGYFLTYDNLSGKPTIPTDIKTLANTENFLRYDTTSQGIQYNTGANIAGTTVTMSTSNLPEGTNQYFTEARALSSLVTNFAGQFNLYNSTFDKGDVRDSLDAQAMTFLTSGSYGQVTEGQTQSKTLRVTDTALKANYAVGQVLRVYGASAIYDASAITSTFSVTPTGFSTSNGTKKAGTPNVTEYSYKIAEYDVVTGDISAPTAAIATSIAVPASSGASVVADAFNSSVFIKLQFASVPADKGIIVFRRIAGAGDYKLAVVLGRKEIDEAAWIDYQSFDYTAWSGKNIVDNTYTEITHFPLTAHSTARRGWVDKTITQIVDNSASFDITLDDWCFINTGTVQVSHNDTQLIQSAINSNSAVGKKSIILNAKTYNTGQITLPSNFGLVGTSYITKMKKLAWTGGEVSNSKFIKSFDASGATSQSIVGIDIDGNSSNQALFPDSTTRNVNYLLDFGINSKSLLLDRVRITNAPAGGIWATSPVELKMNTSEIINSGVTDRYNYSPLVADNGQDTMIVGNRFQNYTDYLDTSVTNKGIVANNVIDNCGSGLFVYGSVFFISSPNVLMGPAQEFLPTPDILNSEYDLINLDLSSAAGSSSDFNSPIHVYQENGAVFDLSATAGSINSVEYRAFYLSKAASGVEEIYGTSTTAGSFIEGKRYTILTLGNTSQPQWTAAATGAQDTWSVGDDFIANANGGTGTGTATSGGVDTITINDRPGDATRANGEFAFTIPSAQVQAIKTANGANSYSTLLAANADHVGIGWTASLRTEVVAATISGTPTWQVDNTANTYTPGNAGVNPTYTITATGLKYLSIDQKVRFDNHTGFNNGGNINVGVVKAITTTGGTSVIIVQFIGADGGTNQASPTALTAGTGGTLNIIDTFVMAQGRII